MSYESVRELQRKLYRAAKTDGSRKFHSLHDKLYRADVLCHAWELVKRNQGTYGVDGVSIAWIEAVIGVDEFLAEIGNELKEGTYRPQPVRRVLIPKPGKPNKTRPISIPTVKDRVCQAACRLVIEPIFEAQFLPNSFGFRPKRSTKDASLAIMRWLNFGCVYVVDADISDCFGSIDTERLEGLVARRIADGYVLSLIKAWLRAGVMQGKEFYRNDHGVPQGGPISPLLSNIYLHELDNIWVERGCERRSGFDAKLIRYADDILIVSSKPVTERLRAHLSEILGEMGLTLSEEKTRVTTAAEGFDFLGFRFQRKYSKAHGKDVTHFFPTPQAEKRARERVRRVLKTGQGKGMSLSEMVKDINYGLRGWTAYYAHTNASRSFGELQVYANNRLRRHMRRRRQRSGLGRYKRMPDRFLYEKLGLAYIRRGRIRYVVS